MVEVMPKFPGGQAGLFQYLARSIKYPVIAQKSKEQGRVIIQMVISKDGSLSNIKVLRSVSPSLDAEAVRVVGNMPKWEPGMQKDNLFLSSIPFLSYSGYSNFSLRCRSLSSSVRNGAFIGGKHLSPPGAGYILLQYKKIISF